MPTVARRKGKILTEEQRRSRNKKQLRRLDYRDARKRARAKALITFCKALASVVG